MAKILIIDDEADLLEMMRLVLAQREGHQVMLSADGESGLAQALADPPDLAIIDVMMPAMNGYEVCRQLRANPSTADTAIIILTARAQPIDERTAMEAGADDYLSKPVMMTELVDHVNALLSKRPARGEPAFAGTIVLMSLRGGVGVTTLAVSLAATLAQAESAEAICLVDLCPSSGHVALQLGLRPQPNWSGLIQADDLDAESVEAHLLQHGSGLRVLASPVFPVVGQGMSPATVKALFSVLQQRFPVVVVDTPPVLDEMTMAALESALVLGLVVTAEAPSIQTTVGTLRVISQRLAPSVPKIQLILNQTTPGDQAPPAMIERTIKRSLAATIPFDPSQARALAQGAPLALRGSTALAAPAPLAQAVTAWAQELILPALRTPSAPRPSTT